MACSMWESECQHHLANALPSRCDQQPWGFTLIFFWVCQMHSYVWLAVCCHKVMAPVCIVCHNLWTTQERSSWSQCLHWTLPQWADKIGLQKQQLPRIVSTFLSANRVGLRCSSRLCVILRRWPLRDTCAFNYCQKSAMVVISQQLLVGVGPVGLTHVTEQYVMCWSTISPSCCRSC